MADASTINGSSSIAIKPAPLFCDDPDAFVAVLEVVPVFDGVEAGADAGADPGADALVPLVTLVLSGTPPAKTFDALTTTAPTTSDFKRWRIYCAPQNSNNLNGISPLNFSNQSGRQFGLSPHIE